jgi:hypothetical protein
VWVQSTILKLTRVFFEGVHLAASLLAGLKPYHPAMVSRIVDEVLEDVTVALDEPHATRQQRHLAAVKLVGEMYNYSLVDSGVVFKVLYAVVNRGHALRADTRAAHNALHMCALTEGELDAVVASAAGLGECLHSVHLRARSDDVP